MTTYSLGQNVTLDTSAVDDNGDPIDATLVLTATKPDGTSITPEVSHIGDPGSGDYAATFVVDQVNSWSWVWVASGAITASSFGQFDVQDPPAPAYAELAELKEGLGLTANDRDARLASLLLRSSRAIEDACGKRKFWLDPVPVVRTFNPRDRIINDADGQRFLVDDIGSTFGLAVAIGMGSTFTTMDSAQYQTGPDSALVKGDPITALIRPSGIWNLVRGQQLQVTARWGYPSIPGPISEATLLLANRRYKRRSSPEGVYGSAEWGVIRVSRSDPDVLEMIETYQLFGTG